MKIALVGNQNCGKSTIFNLLTGSNQKIGNWPGVTVEKKVGYLDDNEIIDLPGTYSLNPFTNEEALTSDYVIRENIDLIINVVDATNLERSLYLTTQLLELNKNIIIVLNMCDLLERKNLKIDEKTLSDMLGINVIKISAIKKNNIDKLKNIIFKRNFKKNKINFYDECILKLLEQDSNDYKDNNNNNVDDNNKKNEIFKKINALKNDHTKRQLIENLYSMDFDEIIISQKYKFIEKVKNNCILKTKNSTSLTDKLDKIFLNKYFAIPIFILIMAFIFYISIGFIGNMSSKIFDNLFSKSINHLTQKLTNMHVSSATTSLLCNGIMTGLFSILKFIPQLFILFFLISLLETSGYMTRISFFFDRALKKVGLSGISLIPFIIGCGCSVPAIMSTRTIKDEKERETAVILTSLMPCSAKLPIIVLFSSYFFNNSFLVATSFYLISIVLVLIFSFILRKTILKSQNSTYITELPEYKFPNIRYAINDSFEKTFSFLKRAGILILVSSIAIWFLFSFDFKMNYGVKIEDSILAKIGNIIAYIFYPMLGTYSFASAICALQGIIAKEQVVSSMAIIAGLTNNALLFSQQSIFSFFTPLTAYSFIVFNLFSAPCIGAISAMKSELHSAKKTIIVVTVQILLAFLFSSIITLIGTIILRF